MELGVATAGGHGDFISLGGRKASKLFLRSAPIKVKHAILLVLGAAVAAFAYYYWIYRPRHRSPLETAYVMSPSLDVLNTYAQVHSVLGILKNGDRVEVLKQTENWAQVRVPGGVTGWVLREQLVDAETYEAGQKLLRRVTGGQVQAVGRTSGMVNLRVHPSREAPQVSALGRDEKVEVFERRLAERSSSGGTASDSPQQKPAGEVWYLVRSGSQAGWVLGRLVNLDIPPDISQYAQSYNLVAWLVLKTVTDNGRVIPEYVVADRVGTQAVDFNHIRVFTWSMKYHHYATAYVESGLEGSFPIRVDHVNSVPYFRLRLVDKQGHKFQKVYGLFDTMVRPVGTVDGWTSDAMPAPARGRRRRR